MGVLGSLGLPGDVFTGFSLKACHWRCFWVCIGHVVGCLFFWYVQLSWRMPSGYNYLECLWRFVFGSVCVACFFRFCGCLWGVPFYAYLLDVCGISARMVAGDGLNGGLCLRALGKCTGVPSGLLRLSFRMCVSGNVVGRMLAGVSLALAMLQERGVFWASLCVLGVSLGGWMCTQLCLRGMSFSVACADLYCGCQIQKRPCQSAGFIRKADPSCSNEDVAQQSITRNMDVHSPLLDYFPFRQGFCSLSSF